MNTLRAAHCSSVHRTCLTSANHCCPTGARSEESIVGIVTLHSINTVVDYAGMTGDVVASMMDAAIMHTFSATFTTGSAGAVSTGSVTGSVYLRLVAKFDCNWHPFLSFSHKIFSLMCYSKFDNKLHYSFLI